MHTSGQVDVGITLHGGVHFNQWKWRLHNEIIWFKYWNTFCLIFLTHTFLSERLFIYMQIFYGNDKSICYPCYVYVPFKLDVICTSKMTQFHLKICRTRNTKKIIPSISLRTKPCKLSIVQRLWCQEPRHFLTILPSDVAAVVTVLSLRPSTLKNSYFVPSAPLLVRVNVLLSVSPITVVPKSIFLVSVDSC